jgi:glutamate-1-semialdehyde 2,1-aminomutase
MTEKDKPVTMENPERQIGGGIDDISTAVLDEEDFCGLANRILPGGGLGGNVLPEELRFVAHKGAGSRIQDVNGRWYIDYVGGAGALILGNAHPAPIAAVKEYADHGIHFYGTTNEACLRLGRELVEAIPCAERIAFTTTGSETTFYAMRMARAFKGRERVLKFEGAYHGNHDYSQFSIAPKSISEYPIGQPDTGGMPANVASNVLIAPYNDLEAVRRIVREHRDDLAAIIVEPVQRVIFPTPGFLPGLRELCDENDVLLIFDEVVTGFRLAYGGAQEYFGVIPDLACYGKIVGGGAPLGCVAGRDEIISGADPKNKGNASYAYINGTMHGNPLAAHAGLATLKEIKKPGFYQALEGKADQLRAVCRAALQRHNLRAVVCGESSFWQILFTDKQPVSYADIIASDTTRSHALDLEFLKQGLYVLPNTRRFISAVHTDQDLEETAKAMDAACRAIA